MFNLSGDAMKDLKDLKEIRLLSLPAALGLPTSRSRPIYTSARGEPFGGVLTERWEFCFVQAHPGAMRSSEYDRAPWLESRYDLQSRSGSRTKYLLESGDALCCGQD